MLRPATPLSILLLISFVLLLISVISTPIVKGIPIARYQGVNFGVFGWCKDTGECSKISIGWNSDEALPDTTNSDFGLSVNVRHSLSSLLIVHPVAALCNLIVLGLAAAAHLHSPSHSARYLLGLLILLLPTLLITLLAFLVDILLFVPHLQWGGWIVLGSTILITASGVVTCAMRRTLVSRKARKKRIAENAEMSGENFYNRQAQEFKNPPAPSTESKMAIVNGGPGADNLPSFATYTASRTEDRPTGSSPHEPVSATSPIEGGRYYGQPRSRSNSRPRQQAFGASLGARMNYEDQPPMPPSARGGYGPPRGRGSFMPRGGMNPRAGYDPADQPLPPAAYGRGGYGTRGRGGMAHGHGYQDPVSPGGTRRPPPNYPPQGYEGMSGGYGPPRSASASRMGATQLQPGGSDFERAALSNQSPTSPMGYGPSAYRAPSRSSTHGRTSPYGVRNQSPGQGRASPYGSRARSSSGGQAPAEFPAEVPPLPAQYAQRAHHSPTAAFEPVASEYVPMQTMHRPPQPAELPAQEYIPARAGWDNQDASQRSPTQRQRVDSRSSHYVEDIDPKFAEDTMPSIPLLPSAPPAEKLDRLEIPTVLTAGWNTGDVSPISDNANVHRSHSFEDLGGRSPVESEVSNFTSVSQRPMNPQWQPGHGGDFNTLGPSNSRYQQQRKHDMLLSNNPDFELPGMSRGRGGSYGPRGRSGSRTGPGRPPPLSVLEGMGADGRYPTPIGPTGPGVMKEI